MKKNFLPLTIALLACIQGANAQLISKQMNIWYFNFYCGIDFNSGVPVSINNSAMYNYEGCTSICDTSGNLLFYSDGVTVYNANHVTMDNGTGLHGGQSSSQSCIAVPQPGSSSIWYLFTTNEIGGGYGGQYNIIDMTQQGGLGSVTVKNVPLVTPTQEKLTATWQTNGTDFWILYHDSGNNNFYAFPLTSSGVGSMVTSSCGSQAYNDPGCMKFSPDGNKVAAAFYGLHSFQVFNFDKATGAVTYDFTLPCGSGFASYGVEWSRDSRHLFLGNVDFNPGQVFEADMTLADSSSIIASLTLVVNTFSDILGSLQMAPDGKIYLNRYNVYYLGVINEPDSFGVAVNYVSDGFSTSPHNNYLGLPNYITSWFGQNNIPKIENLCFGDSTHLYLLNPGADSIVSWDFGDPASGAANTDTGTNVYHVFTATDTFQITIIETLTGGTIDTVYTSVVISIMPVINLGNDTILCIGDTFILDAGNAGAAFSWSNGSNSQTIAVTDSNTYSVTVSNSGCKNTDSISVSFIDCTLLPQPGLSVPDPTICEKFCLDYTDQSTNNPTSWLWTFAGGNPSTSTLQNPTQICYNLPGVYDVTLTASNAFGSMTQIFPNYITVYATPPAPTINQSGYTLYSSFASSYQWQFNSVDILNANGQSYTVTQSGYYTVVVGDSHGCTNYTTVYVLISGIGDENSDFNFLVSPNPSNGNLSIEWLNGLMASEISIDVLNTLGQKVFSSTEKIYSPAWKKEIDLSDVARGVYFIVIKTEHQFVSKKILIAE